MHICVIMEALREDEHYTPEPVSCEIRRVVHTGAQLGRTDCQVSSMRESLFFFFLVCVCVCMCVCVCVCVCLFAFGGEKLARSYKNRMLSGTELNCICQPQLVTQE